jgi:hypothetical protein
MTLNHPSTQPGPLGLGAVAAAETLLVLPASVLLAASVIRLMQPPGREPAHTIGLIAEWGLGHATPLSASILLIAMPLAALAIGVSVLVRRWKADGQLRADAQELLAVAERQAIAGVLLAGALVAIGILAAVVVHVITD